MPRRQASPSLQPAEHATAPPVLLAPRALSLAQATWLAMAALALTVFAAAFPLRHAQISAPPAALRAALEQLGLPLGAYIAYMTGLFVLFPLVCCVVAAVIAWRASDQPMGLAVSLFLIVLGTANEPNVQTLVASSPAWFVPARVAFYLVVAGFTLLLFTFPDGRLVPRWVRWPLCCWLAALLVVFLNPDLYPADGLADTGSLLLFVGALAGIAAQIYRYLRVSGPAERQQTKWVVVGLGAGPIGMVVTVVLHDLAITRVPAEVQYTSHDPIGVTALTISFALIPLSLGLAILRYRLYEIDVLINRTLVYGALTTALAAVYLGSVVVLQGLFRSVSGQESNLAIVVATLASAAFFQPLRRRLQTFIDHRFYRRKYDAARTLTAFSARLRDEVDLASLTDELVRVVDETMRPSHVSLWLRRPEARSNRPSS